MYRNKFVNIFVKEQSKDSKYKYFTYEYFLLHLNIFIGYQLT